MVKKKSIKNEKKSSVATDCQSNSNKRILAGILAIFLANLGVHWFILGKTGKGLTYLLVSFIGIVFIIPVMVITILGLIDGIKLLIMSDEAFLEKYYE